MNLFTNDFHSFYDLFLRSNMQRHIISLLDPENASEEITFYNGSVEGMKKCHQIETTIKYQDSDHKARLRYTVIMYFN